MGTSFQRCFLYVAFGVLLTCDSIVPATLNFANHNSTIRINSGSRLIVGSQISGWDGTLHQEGLVEGQSIVFDGGILRDQDTPAFFRGTYDSDASQHLTLDGSKTLRMVAGDFTKRILVSGTDNKIDGQATFASDTDAAPNIELQDASTTLSLGFQGKVDLFIGLNGGMVTLSDDLCFADEKKFVGDGTINLNNKTLELGGADVHFTNTLYFNDATDVVLKSKTAISGLWTFKGIGAKKDAQIIGNGNILDLGATGTIRVVSGTTLYMTDIKLKGLGLNRGSIVFDDDTSSIRLSDAEIELSNNYSVTTGGFYVEGASRIVTKDKKLVFAQEGTLTVDGVACEYDTLDFSDDYNIIPANAGASSANITLLNNGIVRSIGGLVRQNSDTLLHLSKNNSMALNYGIKNNSMALNYGIKNNSNALLYGLRVNSRALAYGIKNNSMALNYGIKNNSNALLYGLRVNSRALAYGIKNNSMALNYGIKNNSNALLYGLRVNSRALAYGIKNNSMALNYGIKNNSNALLYGLRVNSRALAYGIKNNSMALNYGIKNNSNALLYGLRVNSRALAYGIKNNSNALNYGIKNNSNALLYGLRVNSRALAYGIKNNSMALNYGIKNNSNAIFYCCKNASNAILLLQEKIKNNSMALNYGIKNNSNAIVYIKSELEGDTSWSTRIDANSNTLLYLTKNISNALVYGVKNNSMALNYGLKNNSNAILSNSNSIINNSNAIVENDAQITNNSNALLYGLRVNSRALAYGIKNNSMALNYGLKNNSNAILSNSNSIINNSNAIVENDAQITNNSNALVAAGDLAAQTSNALLYGLRTNSRALVYGIKNNSNAILSNSNSIINNSNAIVENDQQIVNNSNALVAVGDLAAQTSNALAYGLRTYSNAILSNSNSIINNSNAIVQNDADITTNASDIATNETSIRYNSNAVQVLAGGSLLARQNSNALAYCCRTTSNALAYALRTYSNAILNNSTSIINNSNAIVAGGGGGTSDLAIQNSNAIVVGGGGGTSVLAIQNSNALAYGLRTYSNAILSNSNSIINNSNAIEWNDQQITNNSNAVAYCCKNASNAILSLQNLVNQNSSAIEYGITGNSNALLSLQELANQNSNSIAENNMQITNNSNALVAAGDLAMQNSSAIVYIKAELEGDTSWTTRIDANSNTLLSLTKNISNALNYGVKNNSNALAYCCRTTSNALAYALRTYSNAILSNSTSIINNSNAIVQNDRQIVSNSNAVVYGLRTYSNAILKLVDENATLYLLKQNSQALVDNIKETSNALVYGLKNNSNALVYGIKNNSNVLVYGIKNNSNVLMAFDTKVRHNSHAIVYLGRKEQVVSNPFASDIVQSDLILNSTEILFHEIYLNLSKKIVVTCDSVLDGENNIIWFSNDNSLIEVGDGASLTLRNIKLRGFSPAHVSLQGEGQIFFDSNVNIELDPNETDMENGFIGMTQTFTFVGDNNVINGKNFTLFLDNKDIVIQENASLAFRDVVIHNLDSRDVICMDNTATLSFSNVSFDLYQDYVFDAGKINVSDTLSLVGNYIFTYQSTQPLTVSNNSMLYLDTNVTLSYDPLDGGTDKLTFEDSTSCLYMKNSTLHVTSTGLSLTKGKLIVDGLAGLTAETLYDPDYGRFIKGGIEFGNQQLADDLSIEVLSKGILSFDEGMFSYKNINQDSLEMHTALSFIQMQAGISLKLQESLNLGVGVLEKSNRSYLVKYPGKTLIGTINIAS